MAWGKKKVRPGWVQAPSVIELEIRAVWQDDEMPDEIKQSPAYRSFTLGSLSQDWVDSMEEVVDGGDAVYGRPKQPTPNAHRSLTTSLPPTSGQSATPARLARVRPSSQILEKQTAARAPFIMPEIEAATAPVRPPPQTRAPGELMPDIEVAPARPSAGAPSAPHAPMPDIGVDSVASLRARTLPRRVLVPEIGEEEKPSRPRPPDRTGTSVPDIGPEVGREEARKPSKTSMPDIG